jgi:cytochrome c-type biogenesis protein CcmH/NrfG
MSPTNDEFYQKRIAELERENARLRETLEEVKADRRQLAEQVYGPVPDKDRPTEEEAIEAMQNHVPGSGMKWLADKGLYPKKAE